ncbi:pimeloyl-ACP methyl ester carboxylesterase [Rhizobium azibense]|uniref:Pimeloyl-ACP methyl ester carboxylesterase n=1 Tax=Rhizobium azibense TaxID=1136135 RepID=A0A4R3RPC4_9HYPH|nr:alpha/beta hydrolase [Rhizobium azibense]TCU22901.1 pimeloyl-ACP methyl ester carboxylesterase [Rhizobium azibense]TCU36477.1 pimeloyl-ACP methyl ester carboxylesterase [Rhizobium azibense]
MFLNTTEGFEDKTYQSVDGLKLYARDYGAGNPSASGAAPVICLPGLTRNSRDFHQLALILSKDRERPRRVIAIDYRGRGRSAWDHSKQNYNLGVEANDVLTACAAFNITQAAFIGTSRGGLLLHLIAEMKPELLASVVLNDVGPVLEPEGLRHIQAYLANPRKPRDWDDAAGLLRELHEAEFPALSVDDWRAMAHAIYRKTDDGLVADIDPAIAEAVIAADFSTLLPDLWKQFDAMADIPLLVIRGENSKLLSKATVEEMLRRHPAARQFTAKRQGHAPLLHLQDVAQVLRRFFRDL